MANHPITITFANGVIGVRPEEVVVAQNDTLTFTCSTNYWAVQFLAEGAPNSSTRTPASEAVTPTAVNGINGASGTITVKATAPNRTEWDYVIAVWDGRGPPANQRVYTKDPDIVIGSRPGR